MVIGFLGQSMRITQIALLAEGMQPCIDFPNKIGREVALMVAPGTDVVTVIISKGLIDTWPMTAPVCVVNS